MEFSADGNLIARIPLSLAALGYGLATIKADFNKTHATNPAWTGHARFHVVWQVLSYSGIGIITLGLIWLKGSLAMERLYLAAALGAAIYGAFFVSVFARSLFSGSLYDKNGYRPFQPPIGPSYWRWDLNVTVFTIMSTILILGTFAIR
jgi:hypothetical protein